MSNANAHPYAYTPAQLQRKAAASVVLIERQDEQALHMVLRLAAMHGCSVETVIQRIVDMSNWSIH